MQLATRLLRPSQGIALLLVGTAIAVVAALGCRTSLSHDAAAASSTARTGIEIDVAADAVTVDATAEHAQRQLPRQPLARPASLLIAILALAAAVATGLRYTISSVPDAGRATSGLRPPPALRA